MHSCTVAATQRHAAFPKPVRGFPSPRLEGDASGPPPVYKPRGRTKIEDHPNITRDLGCGGLAQEMENGKNKVGLVRGGDSKDTTLSVAELSHEADRIKGHLCLLARLSRRTQIKLSQ